MDGTEDQSAEQSSTLNSESIIANSDANKTTNIDTNADADTITSASETEIPIQVVDESTKIETATVTIPQPAPRKKVNNLKLIKFFRKTLCKLNVDAYILDICVLEL